MNVLYKMVILKMWYIIIVGKSDKVRVLIEYIVYIDKNFVYFFIDGYMGIVWFLFLSIKIWDSCRYVVLSLKKKKKMDDLDFYLIFFRLEIIDL